MSLGEAAMSMEEGPMSGRHGHAQLWQVSVHLRVAHVCHGGDGGGSAVAQHVVERRRRQHAVGPRLEQGNVRSLDALDSFAR